jgi:peptidyl-tRNA hydrolase, PTH1 family
MKLIVGLGNPGRKYAETRHNVGFAALGILARQFGQTAPRAKFHGEMVEARMHEQPVRLLCPQTYMNRSGRSVAEAKHFYQVDDTDLLIICDDFNLPLGRLRCRARGSSGGQKGLQDIIQCLGTEQFARLRIGIGSPPPGWDVAAYVLSKFQAEEMETIRQTIARAVDAAGDWVAEGIQFCMNRYNADATADE